VPGEEERDPGDATVASGSRKDAVEDSRRREGILEWDLAPGALCPELARVNDGGLKPSHGSGSRKRSS
jgi:hypothetical protein